MRILNLLNLTEVDASKIKYDERLTKYFSDVEIFIIADVTKLLIATLLTIFAFIIYIFGFGIVIDFAHNGLAYLIPRLPIDYKEHYAGLTIILLATLPFAAYYLFKRMRKITDIAGSMFYKTLIKIMNYKNKVEV
ncbi:hypothetical protein G7032_19940 [Pseudomonas monteilii]|uniref:hypothetical protein n=1 Tax=Pseudomonas monteilii TaxID=76759 RepID=UPI0015E389B8|nr:hypothetical protein [Pseudomonas monteilii]MBA1318123.1 hypothetical protein [Pseudomonas monteilii]